MRLVVWEGKRNWLVLPNKEIESIRNAVVLRTGDDTWEALTCESPEQAMKTGERLDRLARQVDQLPDYEKAQIVAEARARN
jgi:hypothetical protein